MESDALLSSVKHDWQTPPVVLERVRKLAPIGLDPCTVRENPCGAESVYLLNGLSLPWAGYGLVYCNPPYGRELPLWIEKAVHEAAEGVEIVLLTPSRTDTRWWGRAFESCRSVALWRGRLTFVGAPAPAPFPSCVFYFGPQARKFGRTFRDVARVIPGGATSRSAMPTAPDIRQQRLPFVAA